MKKLFAIFIILLVMFGCGGIDAPDSEKAPIITNVVFFTCNDPTFNPDHKYVFNINDEFDILIYATDHNLDMETLFITEYCVNSLTTVCDTNSYELPDQVGVDRGYHFANCFTVDGPVGSYKFEFQIDDVAGHSSNIFKLYYTIN